MSKLLFSSVITLIIVFSAEVHTSAASVIISFDVDQADFVAPSAGGTQFVEVTDQFASLGALFSDLNFPTLGPVVTFAQDCCLFSLPNRLYSNNGLGASSTVPRVKVTFVDPSDVTRSAVTSSVSIAVTDSTNTTMTAFDIEGISLGAVTTSDPLVRFETISLSGIGDIASVEIWTVSDPTGLDDLSFAEVQPIPEGSTALLLASGLAALAVRRRRGL